MLETGEILVTNPLLSTVQCLQAVNLVFARREKWTKRSDAPACFTLGTAAYLDAAPNAGGRYCRVLVTSNAIISESFDWLLQSVQEGLQRLVGRRCVYHPLLALPGFHIFEGSEEGLLTPSRHKDLQASLINWDNIDSVDLEKQFSFTLPILLPPAGGGLLLWRKGGMQKEAGHQQDTSAKGTSPTIEQLFVRYSIGKLYVHDGQAPHKIAVTPMTSDHHRITLQGHAVLNRNNEWLLYW